MLTLSSSFPLFTTYCIANKNKRFDWLISGPSKAILDRQEDVLDREIEGVFQSASKKDDTNF